jgi:hypothetical protein
MPDAGSAARDTPSAVSNDAKGKKEEEEEVRLTSNINVTSM